MNTLTPDDLTFQPGHLLDNAERGEVSLVVDDGVPVLMAVPMEAGLGTAGVASKSQLAFSTASKSASA